MLPPFGFSVSDLVAGINLVRALIKALEDSAGSAAEYRDLIKELYSLERALLEVKNLDLDDAQRSQGIALRQAATSCQQSVDGFLQKIRKFQPALRTGGSSSGWRDSLRKIEWALCKKDDVHKFRAQLNGHTTSINILLMTLQLQTSRLAHRKLEQRSTCNGHTDNMALANRGMESKSVVLDSHTDLILTLTKIASSAATHEESQDLRELMLKILKSNLQIYDIVLDMQKTLPLQIERQQPVIFLDACARLSPVHLEFITSAEAFLAVLKIRFQHAGLRKIEKGQFALEESRTKRLIDFRQPWHTCFLPGQKIDMSMIFSEPGEGERTQMCPGCRHNFASKEIGEVDCPECGMHYRWINERNASAPAPTRSEHYKVKEMNNYTVIKSRKRKRPSAFGDFQPKDDESSEDSESQASDEIHCFRRVHMKRKKAKLGVRWSLTDEHPLLTARGRGKELILEHGRNWTNGFDILAVHADAAFDAHFLYYEITVSYDIISDGWNTCNEDLVPQSGPIGVGLSDGSLMNRMPGTFKNSVGFNPLNGYAYQYIDSKISHERLRVSSISNHGDQATFGCGWYPAQNQIYFTVDGALIGIVPCGIWPPDSLHPTVGFVKEYSKRRVIANFGQRPFRFDFTNHFAGYSSFPGSGPAFFASLLHDERHSELMKIVDRVFAVPKNHSGQEKSREKVMPKQKPWDSRFCGSRLREGHRASEAPREHNIGLY